MRDYKKFQVWQKAHLLTLDVYRISKIFPRTEMVGLISQIKRSSASIPTNVAEGCGRNSEKEFRQFLYIAFGSANELEYQIILASDLKYIENVTSQKLLIQIEEIKKMLNSLIRKLS